MMAAVLDCCDAFVILIARCPWQAFALEDELEETSPDEELLTMTLLKHQVGILETDFS